MIKSRHILFGSIQVDQDQGRMWINTPRECILRIGSEKLKGVDLDKIVGFDINLEKNDLRKIEVYQKTESEPLSSEFDYIMCEF